MPAVESQSIMSFRKELKKVAKQLENHEHHLTTAELLTICHEASPSDRGRQFVKILCRISHFCFYDACSRKRRHAVRVLRKAARLQRKRRNPQASGATKWSGKRNCTSTRRLDVSLIGKWGIILLWIRANQRASYTSQMLSHSVLADMECNVSRPEQNRRQSVIETRAPCENVHVRQYSSEQATYHRGTQQVSLF